MNETEFLVSLILNDEMSRELHDKLLSRIAEVSKPEPFKSEPWTPKPILVDNSICYHKYPSMWHGIMPPACIKCGYQQPLITTCEIKVP